MFYIISILPWRYLLFPLQEVDTQQDQLKQGVLLSGSTCNCSETSEPQTPGWVSLRWLDLGGIPGSTVAQRPPATGLEMILNLCGSPTPVPAFSLSLRDQWVASLQVSCLYSWERGDPTGPANVMLFLQLSLSIPTASDCCLDSGQSTERSSSEVYTE